MAGLLIFYAWFGVSWYLTRYLAPAACVAALLLAVLAARVARVAIRGAPGLTALALIAAVPVWGAVEANAHSLSATRNSTSALDAITGYRDMALVVVRDPPAGSVVGAWQSGALSYFADGRITVVNLDGLVNPDAARAIQSGRWGLYLRERGIEWLADFTVNVDWFASVGSLQLDPPPKVDYEDGFAQFPPFPQYSVVHLTWLPEGQAG